VTNALTRLRNRASYVVGRARKIDLSSVWKRAGEVHEQHGVGRRKVFADMMWSAAFRETPFQDYVDWDYAILTRAERETFMTHAISDQIARRTASPEHRGIFHDKIAFNERFDALLGREWLDLRTAGPDELEAFGRRHGTLFGKQPVSSAGLGVSRYQASDIDDWQTFHAELLAGGQPLVEEQLVQHPALAEVCPGTVNTTRITAYFDGERTHILSAAQKFGRGQASDQQSFGGFYTMLDENGHSRGRGYDSHHGLHEVHPESGVSIPDFQLPRWEEVDEFMQKVGRVVPEVPYVGWDVVITPDDRPLALIEGNWGAGVYENKPSVTGVRTGSRQRFRDVIGF
jgi:hypothetical protein